MSSRDGDFIFIKWLFFVVGLIIFFIIFYEFGFIGDLIKNDVSFISPAIILIFISFTGYVGSMLYNLNNAYKGCLLLKDNCNNLEKDSLESQNLLNKSLIDSFGVSKNYFLTTIYSHLQNLSYFTNKDKSQDDSKRELSTIFEYKFTKILETGWFVSDLLLKLGLIGTVIGFILMLNSITLIENFDLTMMHNLLQQMSGGMKVALYTTLSGLISSILLSLQYKHLEEKLLDLLNIINEIVELHPSVTKSLENEKI